MKIHSILFFLTKYNFKLQKNKNRFHPLETVLIVNKFYSDFEPKPMIKLL